MTTTTEASSEARAGPRLFRFITGGIAVVLVLVATTLPLWRSHLIAPQYPDGLHIRAYGHGMEGDIAEVDSLNHYIGMRAFDPADVPEMALWPLGVGLAVVAVVVATIARRRRLVWLARAYLWAFPLFILADIQFRLYQYGHDLDPRAALRIPEFTPWVIGPTRVWNFTNVAYPGTGLLLLLLAAAVVTFGPRLLAKLSSASRTGAGAAAALLVLAGLLAAPAGAEAHDGHHHDHGHGSTTIPAAPPRPPASSRPAAGPVTSSGPLAERVAAAAPGETIVVEAGTYHGNVVVDVPVHLEGRGLPTLHGDGTGSTLVIRAPGTTVTGVRVVGSGPGPVDSPAGVRIEADDVVLADSVIEDAYMGIAVVGASRVHITGNTVRGRSDARILGEGHAVGGDDHDEHAAVAGDGRGRLRGDGISLWDVDGVLLRDNTVVDTRDGVYVSFGTWVLIDTNRVLRSRYGVHTMFTRDLTLAENRLEQNLSGAVLMYGGPVLLLRNTILDNRSASTGFGVIVKDVVAVEAVQNVVVSNRVGLHLEGPSQGETPARLHLNTIARNQIGTTLPPSARATFSANSFVDNVIQVGAHGVGSGAHVEWADHGWGNYWSNYRGEEVGRLGRGDTPHLEGSRVDALLERAPVLMALGSSPGLLLVRSVESQRFAADPVVVDPLPLVRPLSPPFDPGAGDRSTEVLVVGLVLVLGAGGALLHLLRPARSARRYAW